jgi:hypothetical protein
MKTGNIESMYIGIGDKMTSVKNGQIHVAIDPSTKIFAVIRGVHRSRELWQVWPIGRKLADYSD